MNPQIYVYTTAMTCMDEDNSAQCLSPPEDATTVAVRKNGNITKYEFYQFENPKKFFGDAWGEQFEMEQKISESDRTPDQIVNNVKWEIEFPTLSLW